jgi:hypothetical protein
MPTAPLTHHEIMALMPPFSREGWRVDLAASDRSARRLVFRRTQPQAPAHEAPVLQDEHLELDWPATGRQRLTRVLVPGSGPTSRLQASGTDLDGLMQRLLAVPARRPFAGGPGWRSAMDFQVEAAGTLTPLQGTAAIDGPGGPGQAQGLTLTLRLPGAPRRGCDLLLQAQGEPRPALPEDVLAVLGWSWARLLTQRDGWKTRLRLPWARARRPAAAEAALQRAATHLAATLAAPPARYHPRHRWARWGVVLRRSIPTVNALSLIAVALAATQMDLDVDRAPGLWVALYHVPTLLVALSFYAQELARFEIPPLPRGLPAEAWGRGQDAAAAEPAHWQPQARA